MIFPLLGSGWLDIGMYLKKLLFTGFDSAVTSLKDVTLGWKSPVCLLFLLATIGIVIGGVSGPDEGQPKHDAALVIIILAMIGYVVFQDGAGGFENVPPPISARSVHSSCCRYGQPSFVAGHGRAYHYGCI